MHVKVAHVVDAGAVPDPDGIRTVVLADPGIGVQLGVALLLRRRLPLARSLVDVRDGLRRGRFSQQAQDGSWSTTVDAQAGVRQGNPEALGWADH